MPYIDLRYREYFDNTEMALLEAVGIGELSKGDLNYVLTIVCKAYLARHGKSYSSFNDILGALEGAKLEFYRRVVAPYEDEKRQQNGDVY